MVSWQIRLVPLSVLFLYSALYLLLRRILKRLSIRLRARRVHAHHIRMYRLLCRCLNDSPAYDGMKAETTTTAS